MSEEKKSEELNIVNETDLPEIPEAFAAEYKKRMAEQTPDIWDKIVAGISEEGEPEKVTPVSVAPEKKKGGVIAHFRKFGAYYGMAAAAVLCIAIAVPVLMNTRYAANETAAPEPHQDKMSITTNDMAGMAAGDAKEADYCEEEAYCDSVAEPECYDDEAEDLSDDNACFSSDDLSTASGSGDADDETRDADVNQEMVTLEVEIIAVNTEDGEPVSFTVKDEETGDVLELYRADQHIFDQYLSFTLAGDEFDNLMDNIDSLKEGDYIIVDVIYVLDEDGNVDHCYIAGMK